MYEIEKRTALLNQNLAGRCSFLFNFTKYNYFKMFNSFNKFKTALFDRC